MTKLYARPYDFEAKGFFFETADEFRIKADKLRNSYDQPVDYIDYEAIARDLSMEYGKITINDTAYIYRSG